MISHVVKHNSGQHFAVSYAQLNWTSNFNNDRSHMITIICILLSL